ncbi:MAG: S8 family peptidase [Chloroflexi bacterium]|nr:S8 family peptidase [Chloroflexota bacterium]
MGKLMCRLSAVLVLALLALLLFTGFASADNAKRKIVVFQNWADERTKDDDVREAGGETAKHLSLINGRAVYLSEQAEKSLRAKPSVLRVDDDLVVEATRKSGGTTTAPQVIPWGVSKISAPQAWTKSTGAGVRVGVLDTGISTSHPDLKVWGGTNTINPTRSFNDDNGHGSHVAGIIAAKNNSLGVVGVAPDAQLYAVKALDRNGSGWLSDIIEGLDWSIAHNINVVNMSLGSSADNQSFHDAISRAYDAGITLVAAAGNSGPTANSVNYPARYPEVIAVSASDQSNNITSWSSRGPEVDLIAPGASIYSTFKGSSYATLSGTSMAAPHVTGVAALRIAIDPKHSPAHIASVLKSNADNLGLTSDQQGSGLVDALRVVTAP